jgi:cytochrome b
MRKLRVGKKKVFLCEQPEDGVSVVINDPRATGVQETLVQTPTSDHSRARRGVLVWDAATRLFHWTLACLVITSWISGSNGFMKLHLWSGTGILTLLFFRLAWGIFGSTTARFQSFLRGPRSVVLYLTSLKFEREAPFSHVGHNPAGGWMVVAFIVVVAAQVTTGLFANNSLGFSGPLALEVSQDRSDQITKWHGLTFNFLLLLVWCHLVAVFFYRFVKGNDLIVPMITGRNTNIQVPDNLRLRFARPIAAWALFALSAAFAAWIVL